MVLHESNDSITKNSTGKNCLIQSVLLFIIDSSLKNILHTVGGLLSDSSSMSNKIPMFDDGRQLVRQIFRNMIFQQMMHVSQTVNVILTRITFAISVPLKQMSYSWCRTLRNKSLYDIPGSF